MDAVDGNAIGGLLIDVFGAEMTAASSTCATCGAIRPVAELVVYRQAPGAVVRCRTCGSVLMVLVRRADATTADLSGLAGLGQMSTPLTNKEGISMPHEQSMSMSDGPQDEPMPMGRPEQETVSMGEPDQESMSMGEPDQETMSMGQPDENPM
jgi:DNA-directed RNA polymerase subunit RPC12/RpoP